MSEVTLRCYYCNNESGYPIDVRLNKHDRVACVDVAACDERAAKAHLDEEEE